MADEEISLLEEELVQLSVKSSAIIPEGKLSLLCTVWTKKTFNLDSFRAQMKSVWKTSKKFDIDMVGQNLFLVFSDNEMYMEHIMEEGSWFFKR